MSADSSDKSETNSLPVRTKDDPTKLYTGGCHCGKFEFEFRHPVVEEGFEVIRCNCSICVQRGYLFMFSMNPKEDFKLTKGDYKDLSAYTFNRHIIKHLFCPVCGGGFLEEFTTVELFAVNVRSIRGLDLNKLKFKEYNGLAT